MIRFQVLNHSTLYLLFTEQIALNKVRIGIDLFDSINVDFGWDQTDFALRREAHPLSVVMVLRHESICKMYLKKRKHISTIFSICRL